MFQIFSPLKDQPEHLGSGFQTISHHFFTHMCNFKNQNSDLQIFFFYASKDKLIEEGIENACFRNKNS